MGENAIYPTPFAVVREFHPEEAEKLVGGGDGGC